MFNVSIGDKVSYEYWGDKMTGTVVNIRSSSIVWVCDDATGLIRWLHRDSVSLVCNAVELD